MENIYQHLQNQILSNSGFAKEEGKVSVLALDYFEILIAILRARLHEFISDRSELTFQISISVRSI